MKHIKNYKVFESDLLKSIGLRLSKNVDITEEDKKWIRDLKWNDFDWEQVGDNGRNIVWLEAKLPLDIDISKGIMIDVQIIKGTLYQLHIHLAPELRGLGLSPKIFRSLIDWLGHIYSGHGRKQNELIDKIWEKLKNDRDIIFIENELGELFVSAKNPDAKQLIEYFKTIGDN